MCTLPPSLGWLPCKTLQLFLLCKIALAQADSLSSENADALRQLTHQHHIQVNEMMFTFCKLQRAVYVGEQCGVQSHSGLLEPRKWKGELYQKHHKGYRPSQGYVEQRPGVKNFHHSGTLLPLFRRRHRTYISKHSPCSNSLYPN